MLEIARASESERRALFLNTASKVGLSAAIVEKDFWVCWTLDYLFGTSQWKDNIAFKGGTSLSLCYGLINRFSEDIDLILDWRVLGYTKDEPWTQRSNRQQKVFCKSMNEKTATYLKEIMTPTLQADFSNMLADSFTIYIDQNNPLTICFDYPRCFQTDYVFDTIRLEIGALAAWSPTQSANISPYVAKTYTHLFTKSSLAVRSVTAERTFWEKITILHKEGYRQNGNFPQRYSRHYYDVYRMYHTQVRENALANLELLSHVAAFKERFYRQLSACYNLATPGTIRLVPPEESLDALTADYRHMQEMIPGDSPNMSIIISTLKTLEHEINRLSVDN